MTLLSLTLTQANARARLPRSRQAVTFYTDRLAPVTIAQQGSVVEDTAFGEYADVLRACRPAAV